MVVQIYSMCVSELAAWFLFLLFTQGQKHARMHDAAKTAAVDVFAYEQLDRVRQCIHTSPRTHIQCLSQILQLSIEVRLLGVRLTPGNTLHSHSARLANYKEATW